MYSVSVPGQIAPLAYSKFALSTKLQLEGVKKRKIFRTIFDNHYNKISRSGSGSLAQKHTGSIVPCRRYSSIFVIYYIIPSSYSLRK